MLYKPNKQGPKSRALRKKEKATRSLNERWSHTHSETFQSNSAPWLTTLESGNFTSKPVEKSIRYIIFSAGKLNCYLSVWSTFNKMYDSRCYFSARLKLADDCVSSHSFPFIRTCYFFLRLRVLVFRVIWGSNCSWDVIIVQVSSLYRNVLLSGFLTLIADCRDMRTKIVIK